MAAADIDPAVRWEHLVADILATGTATYGNEDGPKRAFGATSLKTDGRKGKRVLRALAARWLPPHVAQSPKRGFSIPLDVMAPPDLHTALEDLLLGPGARTQDCTDAAVVRAWLRGFRRAGGGGHGGTISREGLYRRLVSVLALELWLRDYRLAW